MAKHAETDIKKLQEEYGFDDPLEFLSAVDAETEGFNLSSLEEFFGETDEFKLKLASFGVRRELQAKFRKEIGREASQAEISAVFNGIPFGSIKKTLIPETVNLDGHEVRFEDLHPAVKKQVLKDIKTPSFEDFLNDPNSVSNFITKDSANISPTGFIQHLGPRLNQITLAQQQLSRVGGSLTESQKSQILAQGISNDESTKLASGIVNQQTEAALKQGFGDIATLERQGILDTQKQLIDLGQKVFDRSKPSISQSLASLGRLDSGELVNAFSKRSAEFAESIQGAITPALLGASQRDVGRRSQNSLRSALESGQTLQQAINFANQGVAQSRKNLFSAGQSDLARLFSQDIFNQKSALELALAGQPQGPSGLDRFLQVLPSIIQGGATVGAKFV